VEQRTSKCTCAERLVYLHGGYSLEAAVPYKKHLHIDRTNLFFKGRLAGEDQDGW